MKLELFIGAIVLSIGKYFIYPCAFVKNSLAFCGERFMKLEYGGSNNIENLEALCRDCHGKKTAMENL